MRRMIAAVVVVLGSLALLAQADPAVGTWKLNAAKSKYDPGPAPKELVIVIASDGENRKINAKGTDPEGKPISIAYTTGLDGKEVAVSGAPAYDTQSAKRIDANTIEATRKKGGKVVQNATTSVSKDGKTLTITTTGTDERGRKIHNVAVYDRQ